MDRYVALLHSAEKGGYGVSFPDFPGCVSFGRDYATALDQAAEALRFHVDGMIEDGTAVPRPRALEVLRASPEFADDFEGLATTALVPLLPLEGDWERVTLSIDKHLLREVDRRAKALKTNRSAFFAASAQAFLTGVVASTVTRPVGEPASKRQKRATYR